MGLFISGLGMALVVQASSAGVVGTVRSETTGQPVEGAVVAFADLGLATTTDSRGRYLLPQVPPGPQHLSVRFIGYAPRELHALVPRAGELEINVSLRPKAVPLPALEVRSPVIIRGIDPTDPTAFPDRSSSIAAVRNHPQLAEPDVFQALAGGDVVLMPESPNGIHIRGGASDHTGYALDGIPVLSPYHSGGMFSAWNPDALARLDLWSSTPSGALPDALSGTIAATTRAPGTRLGTQGSVSSTHTGLTLDGPLGEGGVGFLVSRRWGFPGVIAPKGEDDYLRGGTGDWLAKLEVPAFGGGIRLLGYDSRDEIDASAGARGTSGSIPLPPRNRFEWHSQSFGAEWSRAFSAASIRVLGWRATSDAGAAWNPQSARMDLSSARQDHGFLVSLAQHSAHATTALGMKVDWRETAYRVDSGSTAGSRFELSARTPVATAFVEHLRAIGSRLEVKLGTSLAAGAGNFYPGPQAQIRWMLSRPLAFSASYARLHQFAQSLRNPESVVGNVFPVDLPMVAGAPGVPVARSDQGILALDYRPAAGVRFGAQAYARNMSRLVLVAPSQSDPFATGTFARGAGTSRGLAADAAVSTARYGLLASYGYQRVRLRTGESGYMPEYGARHLLEAGVIAFPTATTSIRLGAVSAFGRRSTTIASGLEWEACNLLDRGCEFGGSPHYGSEPLGATSLPPYFRLDLGVRKHWHLDLAGHSGSIALFGTVTNLLGRKNVMTYARSASGALTEIEMRPLAPLVVGLDWRF